MDVAKRTGAQAIHPGYGFLSENAKFASSCHELGITFIGPPTTAIEDMGSKSASKRIMTDAGVPCVPGYHGDDQSDEALFARAKEMGYPIMIKAVLGGGGKGMRIVNSEDEFQKMLDSARRESLASFADDRVLLERYVTNPRHVEFQVFADTHGNAVHLFERDCSVQRRHQKVLEEAPAPGMTTELRNQMGDAAVAAAKAVGYVGAGTVEFILEPSGAFYFMEMNTRLQVEHPVSEMITGQDLVEWQLKVASGETLPMAQSDLSIGCHSIEARIYAENPRNGFLPGSGTVKHLRVPTPNCSFDQSHAVRVDSGVVEGGEVSVHYDPMIAKLIVTAEDRPAALQKMLSALREYQVVGLPTNIDFVQSCVAHPAFQKGGVDTGFIDDNVDELLPKDVEATPSTIALAALACNLQSTQTTTSTNPWDTLTNFRSASNLSVRVGLEDESGNVRDVKLEYGQDEDRIGVEFDDERLSVSRASLDDSGRVQAEIEGHVVKADVVFEKDNRRVHLFFAGPQDPTTDAVQSYFQFGIPDAAFGMESGLGGGATALQAPMPGKVVKLLVEPGSQVSIGEPVIVLEAMKMEHVLEAPCDGVIGEVLADVGDFVDDSADLVHFGASDEA